MKKKIAVIGGGFAGISALQKLSRCSQEVSITVFEKKKYFDFLPLLPDLIGRKLTSSLIQYPVARIADEYHAHLVREEVQSINLSGKNIKTKHDSYPYDYILIAGGSETNFYNMREYKKKICAMDSVDDAKNLQEILFENRYQTYIVSGGGYTGVEIASHLWRYWKKKKQKKAIVIVEKAPVLLSILPRWMGRYVWRNISKMGLSIILDASISAIEKDTVHISNGGRFEHALVVWAAGVRTPDFVQELECGKNSQGRIKVDRYLRINESCFIAGDCACVPEGNSCLRMGVQNALTQGRCAAENILRSVSRKPLKQYKPFDPGYLIPMANNRSCGKVLGIPVIGIVPTILHYFMCVLRMFGFKNKIFLTIEIIKKFI